MRFAACVGTAGLSYELPATADCSCAALLLCYTLLRVLKATLVACLALSRFAVLLLTSVRTFAHMCGVVAVSLLTVPCPTVFA